jgi:indole-3-glycerol phosphate synthase
MAERTVPSEAAMRAPRPLAPETLETVPGVLGTIARERAQDYARERLPERFDSVPPRPSLIAALRAPGIGIIAEVKRASPSRGVLAERDPVELARSYAGAGAAAISVLTEPRHFRGRLEHLQAVAAAVELPLLRKDFVVHPVQLLEAREAGASAVLLITAVLGRALADYLAFASALGLEALVEVHDDAELAHALAAGARVLGVNNRDLRTLEIDLALAPRLIERALRGGFDGVCVAESGYAERAELEALRGLADGVLIGSSLAASEDPGAALAALS